MPVMTQFSQVLSGEAAVDQQGAPLVFIMQLTFQD